MHACSVSSLLFLTVCGYVCVQGFSSMPVCHQHGACLGMINLLILLLLLLQILWWWSSFLCFNYRGEASACVCVCIVCVCVYCVCVCVQVCWQVWSTWCLARGDEYFDDHNDDEFSVCMCVCVCVYVQVCRQVWSTWCLAWDQELAPAWSCIPKFLSSPSQVAPSPLKISVVLPSPPAKSSLWR